MQKIDSLKEKSLLIRIIAQLSDQTQTKPIRCTPPENYASFGTNPISRYNRAQTDKQTLYKNTNRVDKKIV